MEQSIEAAFARLAKDVTYPLPSISIEWFPVKEWLLWYSYTRNGTASLEFFLDNTAKTALTSSVAEGVSELFLSKLLQAHEGHQ